MHMLLVIVGGILLLAVFSLFGKLWGGDLSGVTAAAKLFIPVWFVIALTNMWIGVNRAGYTVAQELPILLGVFTVPVIVSAITIWQLSGASSAPLPAHQQEEATMSIILPPVLQSAVNAINAGDEDAFVAAFSPVGIVNDWGRILKGTDGVRSWARSDAIGAKARMAVLEVATKADTTHIVFDWQSSVFNGRSEAYVTIMDGLITEFRIPAK
ncbi:hypothetical protein [Brucella pituitosa]|nr:hypothetical protein [Brucella pituitosa]